MSDRLIEERIGEVLFSEQAIRARTHELGMRIAQDYGPGGLARDLQGRPPLLVCVLHGALIFMADLVRQIPTEIEYDFICVSSYGNETSPGEVRLIKDLERPIKGRDVLIVEDIIDTGYTIEYLTRGFAAHGPASVRICTLIDKVARREVQVEVNYAGFPLEEDAFIVGYGMDYGELYRNLPYIGLLKPEYIE